MFLLVLFAVIGLLKSVVLPRRDVYTPLASGSWHRKKTKSQSDLSDNGTHDGSTAPLSYTARGRTHQGGSPGDLESDRALSPPVTGHPVTGQPITGQLITGQLVTGQTITGQQEITGHPVTGQAHTSRVLTGQYHWSFSHRSSSHWSTNYRSTRH